MLRFLRATIIVFAAVAACTATSAQTIPDVVRYAAVFKNGRSIYVTIAPTADDKAALARVPGINHPIDQVVFLATRLAQAIAPACALRWTGAAGLS